MRLLIVLCSGCVFISKAQYLEDHAALSPDDTGGGEVCESPVTGDQLGMGAMDDVTEADGAVYGGEPYRAMAHGLAGLGDVNADGVEDIGIGYNAGALVLFEAPSGALVAFDEEGSFLLEGAVQPYGTVRNDYFRPVRSGDLDGDGHADLLLAGDFGYIEDGSYAGLFVVDGPITPNAGVETTTAIGDPRVHDPDYVVWHAAVPGDLDGDGASEILVAATSTEAGALGVLSGAAVDGACMSFDGCDAGTFLGDTSLYAVAVAPAGDTNGDGVSEVLVGAPNAIGASGALGDGAAWLLDGAELGTSLDGGALVLDTADALLTGDGDAGVQGVGYNVDGVGDIDEDGAADVLVSSPFGYEGVVYLLVDSGRHQVQLVAPELGATGNKRFAEVALGAGDLNGDCIPDLAVAGPQYQNSDSGAIFVYLGDRQLTTADTIETSEAVELKLPTWTDTSLSLDLAAAGDPDGDGYDDLLIGMNTWELEGPQNYQGVAWYLRGGP